jgi:hypothetical protein
LRRGTTLAFTSFISCRISDGVGSPRRRSPHDGDVLGERRHGPPLARRDG